MSFADAFAIDREASRGPKLLRLVTSRGCYSVVPAAKAEESDETSESGQASFAGIIVSSVRIRRCLGCGRASIARARARTGLCERDRL